MSQHEQQRSGSVQAEADRLKRDADVTAQRAQGEARNIAAEAKGAARDVADEAREIGSSVKSEALGVVSAVRQGLADKAEEQKDGVADRIGAIADRAHSTADELRDREAWLAGLIDRGARELDGFADAVRHRDINTIWSSLESFGRRQPALFMGAAVAAGFALTRLVAGLDGAPVSPGLLVGRQPWPRRLRHPCRLHRRQHQLPARARRLADLGHGCRLRHGRRRPWRRGRHRRPDRGRLADLGHRCRLRRSGRLGPLDDGRYFACLRRWFIHFRNP